MTVWLGLSCPTCGTTRDLSPDDRTKLKAKHPVECANGHRFRREDGFLHWVIERSPFGSALMSADVAFDGEIPIGDLIKVGGATRQLPKHLHASKVSWREPSHWSKGRGTLFQVFAHDDRVFAFRPPFAGQPPSTGSLQFQVVGAADLGKLPGWRQVLAEAFAAFEEGRYNVAALLGNVAFETFYSSIADPILTSRGMPENVVQLIHVRMPLENRLEHGFAHPLGLPCLNDAPFWSEWKRKSRQCRNSLAHRWVFDQNRKNAQATRDDARSLLFYHLKALCHLDPHCFDWLLKLEAKKMTSR